MAGSGWDDSVVGSGVQVNADGTAERPDAGGGGTYAGIRGLAGRSRGKRYFEISGLDSGCAVGLVDENADLDSTIGAGSDPSQWALFLDDGLIYYRDTGGNGSVSVPDSKTSTSVIGVLMDFDNHQARFYEDGVEVAVYVMSFSNDMVLYPAMSMGSSSAGYELQTVEPFESPPEITFIAWDLPDSALGSKISGLMTIDDSPVSRTLKAFTYERLAYSLDGIIIQESRPLGQTVSDAETGEYEIILRDGFRREVFVVAFDDYGKSFVANFEVSLGDKIHPTIPNGYVYECDGNGTLPANEPTWSTDSEVSQIVGTASFSAIKFYRPEVHGPLIPEFTGFSFDEYWENVISLLHFDESLTDETGRTWTVRGGASSSDAQYKFGGSSMYVPTSSRAGLYHPASSDFALSEADFTIEMFVFPVGSNDKWFLEIGGGTWTTRFWLDRTDGKLRVAGGPAVSIWIHNGIIPDDEWSHIAATIEDGVLKAFVSGEMVGSANIAGEIPSGSLAVGIGHTLPGTSTMTSNFIDEFRVTKGVARYTENFTPPSSPFPNA